MIQDNEYLRNLNEEKNETEFATTDISKELKQLYSSRAEGENLNLVDFWMDLLTKKGFISEEIKDKFLPLVDKKLYKTYTSVDHVIKGIIAISGTAVRNKIDESNQKERQSKILEDIVGEKKIDDNSSGLYDELLSGEVDIDSGEVINDLYDRVESAIEFIYSEKYDELYDCVILKDFYDKVFSK